MRNRLLIAAQNPFTRAVRTAESWKGLRRLVRPHATPVWVVKRKGEAFVHEPLVPFENTVALEGAPKVRPPILEWSLLADTKEKAADAIRRYFPDESLEDAIARTALSYAFGIPSRAWFGKFDKPESGKELFRRALKAFKSAESFIAQTLVTTEEAA